MVEFFIIFKNKKVGIAASVTGIIGFSLHFISFIIRWIEFYDLSNGQILRSIPITNKYESLMFFALLLSGFYVVLEYKTKNKSLGVFAFAISGSFALFISAIGAPSDLNLLVPALKSNWLLAHVSLSFTAYVCFTVAAIAAILYLIKTVDNKKRYSYIIYTFVLGVLVSVIITLIINIILGEKANTINMMIIFVFFTVSFFIIFYQNGLSLKNLFNTWIIYGLYLHGRLSNKWSKELAATVALIGLLSTIFTFLGVNLLIAGLHSYGS